MTSEILLYYTFVLISFLLIAPIVSKRLMKNFHETESLKKQTRIGVGILLITSIILTLFVSPYFLVFSMFIGTGLIYQGITGFCGLTIVLSKMPWNK
ncbi:MAG: DUF2892 domain-containing protein [Alphaproteobacteria bacterium]|nr:DUF2892 domain-containing protein [Alphaproteobacteria bacterium]MBN2675209.1 DUF2892 domain-containing protein [Alphaproteobacteria bacterium]